VLSSCPAGTPRPAGRSDPADPADRGSALLLMPACVLIMLVLASITVDMALVHLRQRQAFDVAAAAANDAVTAGVDTGALRSGTFVVQPAAARRVVARSVAASELAPHLVGPPRVTVDGDRVEVRLTLRADYLFTGVMPGTPDATTVSASASATAMSP
jgi:Flp pilus assembly protein TadG